MRGARVPVNNNILRAKRLHKRISVKDAAEYVGVNPVTISRWEEGYSTPLLRQSMLLAECYGCNVRLFFTETARVIWDHFNNVLLLSSFVSLDDMEAGEIPSMDMSEMFSMAERLGMLSEVESDVEEVTASQEQLASEIR